jgi:hypothetical protein
MPKKFHITPDGKVAACKAHLRACPFGEHYSTEAGAQTAYNLRGQLQERNARNADLMEQARQQHLHEYNTFTSAQDHIGELRTWTKMLPPTYTPGQPVYIKARQTVGTPGGTFSLSVTPEFDTVSSDFVHTWTFFDSTNTPHRLTFNDGMAGARSLALMDRVLIEDAAKTYATEATAEEASAPYREKLLDFMRAVNAETSDQEYEWGNSAPSYVSQYRESGLIPFTANYAQSSIRPATIDRFVRELRQVSPAGSVINVAIFETAPGENGATWELRRSGGNIVGAGEKLGDEVRSEVSWSLSVIGKDGESRFYPLAEPADAYSSLYWFVKNDFPHTSDEEALERGAWAQAMMEQVNASQSWLDEVHSTNRQASAAAAAHRELLAFDEGQKKTAIDKFFNIFS